jgi:hypothetical protein
MLRHVVLIRFKPETPATAVKEIETTFAGLAARIPEIRALEWGTDCSPEGKSQGFSHCFFLTFAGAPERDAYLPHPEHRAFSGLLRPHAEQVLVIDYEPAT